MNLTNVFAVLGMAALEQSLLRSNIEAVRRRMNTGAPTEMDSALVRGFETMRAEFLSRSVTRALDEVRAAREAERVVASLERIRQRAAHLR